MRGQPRQRGRDRRHGPHRPDPVQPAGGHRIDDRAVDRSLAFVWPEHVRREAHRQHNATATGRATMKMIAAAPVSPAPNAQRGKSMKLAPRNAAAPPVAVATEFIDTTCLAWHHVWQRRRQARGDEAGESVDDQGGDQNCQIVCAGRKQRGDGQHHQQASDVGADEHQAPVPPVQQRTGERAEQRVGQVKHGERAGDGPRRCGTLGVEQESRPRVPRRTGRHRIGSRSAIRAVARIQVAHAPNAKRRSAHARQPQKSRPVEGSLQIGNPTHSTNIPAGRACSPP